MTNIYAELLDFPANCGFEVLGEFQTKKPSQWAKPLNPEDVMSGTGIVVATFNEKPASKAGYDFIKENFEIIWQSESYPNLIHRDESNVFMVVFKANRVDKYEE